MEGDNTPPEQPTPHGGRPAAAAGSAALRRRSEDAPPETLAERFDLSIRMHVLACPACGIRFAVPALFHLQMVEQRRAIACPNQHAEVYADPTDTGPLGLVVRHALTLAELEQARHALHATRVELARWKPADGAAPPISKKELLRRSRIMAARGEQADVGRRVCRFCGKLFHENALATHIRRRHADDLREMPESVFE